MRASFLLFPGAAVVLLGLACLQDRPPSGKADGVSQATPRATGNATCLRCHAEFADEPISKVHAKHELYCDSCHGASTAHAASGSAEAKPDQLFGRSDTNTFCESCHKPPHPNATKVAAWAKKREGQILPSGKGIMDANICTDCHGAHVMKRPAAGEGRVSTDTRHQVVSLFNGRDLTGWKPEGKAIWKVEDGMLVGTQGPDFAPGDLFTEATYCDFDLTVTYKVVWPANTGIWFRYQTPQKAYQGDILEYAKPEAYSGTIYCPGKLFLGINADKGLVNRDGWNVMRIRAQGPHLQVWLNGIRVAEAQDSTIDCGRIGFQVHPGKEFGPMKMIVRQILLEPL